jgi:hypothetical protein
MNHIQILILKNPNGHCRTSLIKGVLVLSSTTSWVVVPCSLVEVTVLTGNIPLTSATLKCTPRNQLERNKKATIFFSSKFPDLPEC